MHDWQEKKKKKKDSDSNVTAIGNTSCGHVFRLRGRVEVRRKNCRYETLSPSHCPSFAFHHFSQEVCGAWVFYNLWVRAEPVHKRIVLCILSWKSRSRRSDNDIV